MARSNVFLEAESQQRRTFLLKKKTKKSNTRFAVLTFCFHVNKMPNHAGKHGLCVQIIVGIVAVCSFLSDPFLFLFADLPSMASLSPVPALHWLTAASCNLTLYFFCCFGSTCVFLCHGHFTPSAYVVYVVFQPYNYEKNKKQHRQF